MPTGVVHYYQADNVTLVPEDSTKLDAVPKDGTAPPTTMVVFPQGNGQEGVIKEGVVQVMNPQGTVVDIIHIVVPHPEKHTKKEVRSEPPT